MGNWFSSSRPSSPTPTLTSIQPRADADGTPAPRPSSTVPNTAAAAEDDPSMPYGRYSSYYNPYASRYRRNRYRRYTSRYPWYSYGRSYPRSYERDYSYLDYLRRYNDNRRDVRPRQPSRNDDTTPEVPARELNTKLHVKSVDLNIERNSKAHHTDRYDCCQDRMRDGKEMKAELVVRRGQEFTITIETDRPFKDDKNDITLVFILGNEEKPNQNVNVTFKVDENGTMKYKPKKWGALKKEQKGNFLTLDVFAPASCPLGEWDLKVRTIVDVKNDKDIVWEYDHNQPINIICNPWCKEDWVYLDDDLWREEAVLNENGNLYRGNSRRISALPWNFGQFQDGVLESAFFLLRKGFGFSSAPAMGNVAVIARLVSQMVNSQDDTGVLSGNWSGDYSGGISPSKWKGSVKILKKYMDSEGKAPVKFGQCWVFSGVTTTICRALGIPCRSITNFSSAHNTDSARLSIDYYVNDEDKGSDSIWNFHVWNEVWMARPDLGREWDGWQVIDATPQERSDGVFCCGPAPVKAIKEGKLTVGKDAAFIFSEVNSDKVMWLSNPGERDFPISRDKSVVGQYMSTHKATGRAFRGDTGGSPHRDTQERLDVTEFYKYKEGTDKEREIVRSAERQFRLMHIGYDDSDDEFEEVKHQIEIDIEDPGDVLIGNDFEVIVRVRNITDSTVTAQKVLIKVVNEDYTGTFLSIATELDDHNVKIERGRDRTFKMRVTERLYSSHPDHSFNFNIVALVIVDRVDQVAKSLKYRLRRPDIILKPEAKRVSRFKDLRVSAVFTNPFHFPLTRCEIELDGRFSFINPRGGSATIGNIGPGQTWGDTFTVRPTPWPRYPNERELTVGFQSAELDDIYGYVTIELE